MEEIEGPDVDKFNPDLFRKGTRRTPIPFVIDKAPNISEEAREALSEWIMESGGSVVDALPEKGSCFFVFDAGVSKHNAVKLCTKPLQHPIHFSWIITSIEEDARANWAEPMPDEPKPVRMSRLGNINPSKRILEDFVTETKGYQLPIYIDYSIQGDTRGQLAKAITQHGGFLTLFEDQARIIVADQANEEWHRHIWGEEGVLARIRGTDRWIEPPSTIRRWIRERGVSLTPAVKPTTTPGRRPSTPRTEFTAADDRLLVRHLAGAAPFGRGRQGDNIYHELEDKLERDALKARKTPAAARTKEDNEVIYASQHTWQSWQNRYKKSKEDFDQRINRYLEVHPYLIQRGGEAKRRAVQLPKGTPRQTKKKVVIESDVEEEDPLEQEDEDEAATEPQDQADEADAVVAETAALLSDDDGSGEEDDAREEAPTAGSATAPGSTLPPAYATQAPAGHTTVTPPASPTKAKRGRGRPRKLQKVRKVQKDPRVAELLSEYSTFVTEGSIRRLLDAKGGDVVQARITLRQMLDFLKTAEVSPGTEQHHEGEEDGGQEGEEEQQDRDQELTKKTSVSERRSTRSSAKRAAEEEQGPISRRTRQKPATSSRAS